jgi:hypothetical protein
MKKLLLTGAALAMFASAVNAQNRLVLYEEFSGENCGPCAATNPGLWSLLTTGSNEQDILIIKYQVNIPSGGPIYYENTADVNTRKTYYGVMSAPYARIDGAESPGDGHPGYLTQEDIDDAAAVASPFDMEVISYSITGSTVTASVNVTATSAITAPNMVFHATLNESLHFSTPPGSNGETEFHHVVRKMYPSASGQEMEDSWTVGESHTYTISGTVPSYVDLNNEHFLTFWIQDNADKSIKQAVRTYPDLDVVARGMSTNADPINCGTPFTVTPKTRIKNGGVTNLTSATIYYKPVGAPTWSTKAWTGNLATEESIEVTLDPVTLTTSGLVGIIDSVGNPNGSTDKFASNNKSGGASVVILKDEDGTFPLNETFEPGSSSVGEWVSYANSDGYPFYQYQGAGIGYDGSNNFLLYENPIMYPGTRGYAVLPFIELPSGAKAMDFYVAYSYVNISGTITGGSDKLEIVYSENCGASWTPVWSATGDDLVSAPTPGVNQGLIPTSNAQWRQKSADISSIPAGAQIALRATAGNGNYLFVDNVNVRTGLPLGIEDVMLNGNFAMYPNPVVNELNIDVEMIKATKASITISNVVGQTVGTPIDEALRAGKNHLSVSTAHLAPGVYFLNIKTESGNTQQKFVKQ